MLTAAARVALVLLLVLPSLAAGQSTEATLNACLIELDQARILVRMLGQGRGQAELALAEAQARVIRLERELEMFRKRQEPPK